MQSRESLDDAKRFLGQALPQAPPVPLAIEAGATRVGGGGETSQHAYRGGGGASSQAPGGRGGGCASSRLAHDTQVLLQPPLLPVVQQQYMPSTQRPLAPPIRSAVGLQANDIPTRLRRRRRCIIASPGWARRLWRIMAPRPRRTKRAAVAAAAPTPLHGQVSSCKLLFYTFGVCAYVWLPTRDKQTKLDEGSVVQIFLANKRRRITMGKG